MRALPRRDPLSGTPFLSAEWRDLLIVNYEVAPERLRPFVPAETELDLFEGKALVSFVGFRFLRTRVHGLAIPGHVDFLEMNLRFYVRRILPDGTVRRGVTFLGEVVPRRVIAFVARTLYGEPYTARAMRRRSEGDRLGYECAGRAGWRGIGARVIGVPRPATDAPATSFITEHYWGYTRRSATRTDEYEVRHPVWEVRDTADVTLDIDPAELYGAAFSDLIHAPVHSALVAEGSPVTVHPGAPL